MSREQTIAGWVDAIEAHNFGKGDAWHVRFEIEGLQLVEQAVKRLSAIGATMGPNGRALQYIATFPGPSAREVASILVEQGARLCSDQALAPVP